MYHPSVDVVGSQWLMYYTGESEAGRAAIGLATSRDGCTWVKHPSNPVLEPGPAGAWDSGGVHQPPVLHEAWRFVMAYAGWSAGTPLIHGRIGIATSSDGLTWLRLPRNPVLDYGLRGAWDEYGLLAPRMWYQDGVYHMNYSGKPNE